MQASRTMHNDRWCTFSHQFTQYASHVPAKCVRQYEAGACITRCSLCSGRAAPAHCADRQPGPSLASLWRHTDGGCRLGGQDTRPATLVRGDWRHCQMSVQTEWAQAAGLAGGRGSLTLRPPRPPRLGCTQTGSTDTNMELRADWED